METQKVIDPASDSRAPTTLTAEQVEMVSGGVLAVAVLRGGCPFCTSGLQLAFQSIVNVVNPGQIQMQAFG
jgi:hypothetical protein